MTRTPLQQQHPGSLPPVKRLLRRAGALWSTTLGLRGRARGAPSTDEDGGPGLDDDPRGTTLGEGAPPAGSTGRTPFGAPPGGTPGGGPSEPDTYSTPG